MTNSGRRRAAEFAEHNGALEGQQLDAASRDDAVEYVDGAISAQTLVERARAVHFPDEALLMAEIEKGQQLAGHLPNEEALGRVRRLIRGEITSAEARAEIDAKYSEG